MVKQTLGEDKQYLNALHEGAEHIAKNHLSLTGSNDIADTTGLGVYAIKAHYIFYLPISNEQIIIVALIRQIRDIPTILKTNQHHIRREVKAIFKLLNADPAGE